MELTEKDLGPGFEFRETDDAVYITIPLEPVTKKNSSRILMQKSRDGRTVPFIAPSKKYKEYEESVKPFLKRIGIPYPVNIEAHFYMKTRRKVDLTNLNEALHDVLVSAGVLVDDNATIVVSTDGSRVYFSPDEWPRTEVIITPTARTFFPETGRKKRNKKKNYKDIRDADNNN